MLKAIPAHLYCEDTGRRAKQASRRTRCCTVRFSAGNLEQVANLLCAQVNSASYPQRDRDGKRVSYGLRGEGLVWLTGVVVCLLAANRRVELFADAGNGWPHSALRYH